MPHSIHKLTICGFKSIRNLQEFMLHDLNILIGPNGSGKSNLVSFFRMLTEMAEERLQLWIKQQGSADRIVSFGVKETKQIEARLGLDSKMQYGDDSPRHYEIGYYEFTLEAMQNGSFVFVHESIYTSKTIKGGGLDFICSDGPTRVGDSESRLKSAGTPEAEACYQSIVSWKVYHFHDTGDTAGMKRLGSVHDNVYLRSDASNLAAYLYRLQNESPEVYEEIRKTVQLAIPFFDDFTLRPQPLKTGEEQIRLLWQQKGSDYPLWPSQLSDGSLRLICLVTALLQPVPPSTIIIDEPELGLHPYAITLLGALLRSASKRMQVIVSTQSVPLLNEFSLSDLIVVERKNDETVFKRLNESDFAVWLEDYSIGELWEKNILGGRPQP